MALFNKNKQNFSPIERAINNFRAAKGDLLFIIIATVVNLVLLFIGSGNYFLFSASIPYYLCVYGLLFTGRLPEEYYTGDFAGMPVVDDTWLYIMVALAFIVLALYVLCFFMLKKPNKVWFIIALVAFSVDSVALLLLTDLSAAILDVVFHGLIIFYLIRGLRACIVIKNFVDNAPQEPLFEDDSTAK